MKESITNLYQKLQSSLISIKENEKVRQTTRFFTDTSSYKKTVLLSLLFVFIFYLPFTFITIFLNKVVFFQLDYVYQFSTIIFDFRNRLMDFNFSTWDFKNSIGYDYFANFYYIPLDITLLPYFLFPFLAYSKLMWLSFLMKVLLGTFAFSYLLKLYKFNHKTILLISVLYGTADLFFAQNVFPSYSGLTFYIPLILIAIELMFQKRNFWVFPLVIFQVFLFNSYWAWGLSLFMALALLFRTIFEYFTFDNIFNEEPYKNTIWFIFRSILLYLLGLGLAAFFFLPTFLGIMGNEPRMELSQEGFGTIFLNIFDTLKYNFSDMVHYKEFFKMLVPNLYMYSGFFHDTKADYWLTTNHVVIYSSILASFSLFFLILYPTFLAKQKLNPKQVKVFITLKVVTIFATIMLLFPFTAYLFSLNSGPYLRWLIFYGVLLVINLAFIIEYKLFQPILFASFLVISIGYLIFSIQYNREFVANYKDAHNGKAPNIFTGIDENVAYTMIITYIIILFMIIILDKYFKVHFALLVEKVVGIGLIFAICVSPHFTKGVRHADLYGREVNRLMENVELDHYYTLSEFLFYDDKDDVETMQDMTYLYDFPVYNNFNIFHSLINPYFTFHSNNNAHKRYYRGFDIPYLYYYYMDPSLFIMSNSKINPIKNGMYDPVSELVGYKEIDELESYLTIYQKDSQLSIGNGFKTYYTLRNINKFDYLWLESFYIKDEETINLLKENGFNEENTHRTSIVTKLDVSLNDVTNYDMEYYSGDFNEYPIHITKEQSEVVIIGTTTKTVFAKDNDGNIKRCYNKFCFVPEVGLQSIIIDKSYASFYTVDKDYVEEKIEELVKYSTYDVKIDGNHISSKIDNDESIIMTYKVGYAKGWNVYVDNQKVEAFPSYNGQLSFILQEPGTHQIDLVYKTPYLNQGLYITSISMVIFAGLVYLHIKKDKND